MTQHSLLRPELCFTQIEATNATDLFTQLEPHLSKHHLLVDNWLDGITSREQTYPTGLQVPNLSFAIPHADPCYIKDQYFALIKPKDPIRFGAMGGLDEEIYAELVINLGIMRGDEQVLMLQTLMNMLMDPEHVTRLKTAESPTELYEAFEWCFARAKE